MFGVSASPPYVPMRGPQSSETSSRLRPPSGRATSLSTIIETVWLSIGSPVAGE